MDLDALLLGYFGTTDLGRLTPPALVDGMERLQVDFGRERDQGRRFALWSLLYMLGRAPDLDLLDPADRDAARTFMNLADQKDGRG